MRRQPAAGKKLINSNVAIELGYALRALTDRNVLLVFNEHYGKHDDLPFDLRHKGGSIVFNLAPDADKRLIEEFSEELPRALRVNPIVEVPADVLLVTRVMGLLSGLGKTLDSRVDLFATIMPYAQRLLAPEADAESAAD